MSDQNASVLQTPEEQHYQTYQYSPEEQKFVSDWWNEFMLLWIAKNAPQDILGGRTLQGFWDDSVRDYAVIAEQLEDPNDPVQQYVSSVSRDKADVFIGNMVSQLLYPSVKAVNVNSKTDRTLSKVSRSLLEWAQMNDGYPSETGIAKNVRYVHKMVVEGTLHVQDDVSKEDALTSSLVPNEEIFVPNFWEANIQLQSHLIRAQLNVTYENAERVFGDCPNFQFVAPQFTDFWFIQRPEYKQIFQGIVKSRRVQVMHVWKDLSKAQLQKEKDAGRLTSKTKRAKYYNVLINDIPMYPVDNLSPYKDGLYPISKGIFALLSKSEYYWGNSLPNKIRYDKRWLDSWKTLLRYKGKLNLLPPMVSLNGNFVDEEILLPAKITPITEELQLKRIEGVADPISQADVMLLDMAEKEIDRGTVSPSMSGQMPTKRMTKAEAQISDMNAKQLLDIFSLQLAILAQSRSYAILRRLFQFLPRGKVDTITVSDQKLSDGLRGDLEVVFKKLPKLTQEQIAATSEKMLQNEIQTRQKKEPVDTVFIDPDYLEDINLFLFADAASLLEDKDATKKAQYRQDVQIYLSRPDLFDQTEVARQLIRANDDPEEMLVQQTTQIQSTQLPDYAKASQVQQPFGPTGGGQGTGSQFGGGLNAVALK